MLPIVALGGAIVRPELTGATSSTLRWHVNFNGQTLLLQRAAKTKLPLDPILAKGGLGRVSSSPSRCPGTTPGSR